MVDRMSFSPPAPKSTRRYRTTPASGRVVCVRYSKLVWRTFSQLHLTTHCLTVSVIFILPPFNHMEYFLWSWDVDFPKTRAPACLSKISNNSFHFSTLEPKNNVAEPNPMIQDDRLSAHKTILMENIWHSILQHHQPRSALKMLWGLAWAQWYNNRD